MAYPNYSDTNLNPLILNYVPDKVTFDQMENDDRIEEDQLYLIPEDDEQVAGTFFAEYNVTTWDEVVEAIDSGKNVIAVYDYNNTNIYLPLTYYNINDQITFEMLFDGEGMFIALNPNNAWYREGYPIGGSSSINLSDTISSSLNASQGTAATPNAVYSALANVTATGDVTGSMNTASWNIATTIADNAITSNKIATNAINNSHIANFSISSTKLENPSMNIAGSIVALGGSLNAATLVNKLGLSTAMHFIGKATVAITDNSTTNPNISGYDFTSDRKPGDVIIDSNSDAEYVWTINGTWEKLGSDSSFKLLQSAVTDPTASGSCSAFIDSISQNEQGVITVTKKTVALANIIGSTAIGSGTQPIYWNGSAFANANINASIINAGILPISRGGTGQNSAANIFTALSWTAGNTSGPNLSVTILGQTRNAAIPAASDTASGVVTTGTQRFQGNKTFYSDEFRIKNSGGNNNQVNNQPYVTEFVLGDGRYTRLTEYADDKMAIRGSTLILTNQSDAVYNNVATYSVGNVVWYSNNYYRCKTAISTAEEFNASNWSAYASSGLFAANNFSPVITNLYSLGTSSYQWTTVYANSINASYLSGNGASISAINANNVASGTLSIARGGTGLTSAPSVLVNLSSTTAANILTASPRPGVTGVLPIAYGGTNANTAANALKNLIGTTAIGNSSTPVYWNGSAFVNASNIVDEKVKAVALNGENSGKSLLVGSSLGGSSAATAYASNALYWNDYDQSLTIHSRSNDIHLVLRPTSVGFYKNVTTSGLLSTVDLTAQRSYKLPDASGTIALVNSPTLVGTPTAPTAAAGTNTTQIATTAFVTTAIAQASRIQTALNPSLTASNGAWNWSISAMNINNPADIIISVYEKSTGIQVYPDVTVNQSSGAISISINDTQSNVALAANTYKAVIIG